MTPTLALILWPFATLASVALIAAGARLGSKEQNR